jgi:tetratricopeptide (TPR) repeat protein
MHLRGSVIFVAAALSFAVAARAQKPASSTGSPASTTNGTTNGSTNTRQPSSTSPNDSTVPQVIFISGTVVVSDGLPLPERVKIERVCGGPPRLETYTDKKGHFSFQVGQNLEMQDASSQSSFNGPGSPLGNMNNNGGSSGRAFNERDLWGCELKAELPGFRSDLLPLSNVHYMDNPDVGTIILHRLGKVDGLTISVVSALAPKDARKAYEKAQAAAGKHNWDEAQKDFEKAVEIYPKYSAAWFDLGRLQEENGHFDDARKAYEQAIAAEPKYIQPFERLSWLALRESKWQDLVDRTDQWLRLDPLNSADVYYLSSLGNLQTQHIDIAEKNAREAIRLDPAKKNMRTRYILGLTLAQKQDFVAAAAAVREYLATANPEAKETEVIRKQLAQIDDAAKEQTAAVKPQ